jgi:hypothetical protein
MAEHIVLGLRAWAASLNTAMGHLAPAALMASQD